MGENDTDFSNVVSGTPSEQEKKYNLRLSYECTDHRASSYEKPTEMFAFIVKVEDLMHRLLRFTPSEKRKELQDHYTELAEEIKEIDNGNLDPSKKKREILDKQYKFALGIHNHNLKLIPNTSILQRDVEGELDITDKEAMEIIQGGKRKDVTGIQLHR